MAKPNRNRSEEVMERLVLFLIYLIYFTTPFESVGILQGFSLVKLVTILFIPITFFYYSKIPFENSLFLKLISIYTLYIILSTIWSIDTFVTFKSAIGTALPSLLLTLFVFKSIQRKEHINRIFQAYSFGSIALSLYAFYLFIKGSWYKFEWEQRLSIFEQDQNELSFLLSMGIVSLIYLIRYTSIKYRIKLIYSIFVILLAFTILLTGSRTGFLILLIILLLIPFSFSNSRIKRIFTLAMCLGIGASVFSYLPVSTSARLMETGEQIKDKNLTNRVDIWQRGLEAFDKQGNYILGTGFNTFSSLLESTYYIRKAPHNTYLGTFIELGLIGLIMFLLIINYLLKKVFILYEISSFYLLLILPLLIAMITLGTENRRWLYIFGILIVKLSNLRIENSES